MKRTDLLNNIICLPSLLRLSKSRTPNKGFLRSVAASWCRNNTSTTIKRSFNFVKTRNHLPTVTEVDRLRTTEMANFHLTSNCSSRSEVHLRALRLKRATNRSRNTRLLMRVRQRHEEIILNNIMRSWTPMLRSNKNLSNNNRRNNWCSSRTFTMTGRFLETINYTCKWWVGRATNRLWDFIFHMLTHQSWFTPNLTREETIRS